MWGYVSCVVGVLSPLIFEAGLPSLGGVVGGAIAGNATEIENHTKLKTATHRGGTMGCGGGWRGRDHVSLEQGGSCGGGRM